MVSYLQQENITHTLAHPLWSVNGRLTIEHFEKLLLLFKNFEINGSRDEQLNLFLRRILGHLTPGVTTSSSTNMASFPDFPNPGAKT